MKEALVCFLFGLSLAACRGVALEQRLADLPPGKTSESGAFTGNFVIPVSEVRKGAALYIQNGNTTTRLLQINPREPFCVLSSIRSSFNNESLAALAKVDRVKMRRYRGLATEGLLDRVFITRQNGSYRAGGTTSFSLGEVNPGLKYASLQFTFEGALDCYREADAGSVTSVLTVGTLFKIMGFEWIWDPPAV